MKSYKTHIDESNPKIHFIYHSIVNLHTGKVSIKKNKGDQDSLFEKMPDTYKSRFILKDAEIKNGYINVYFIVLDSKKAFLFLKGNTPESSIKCGGFFVDIKDLQNINHMTIDKFLKNVVKEWSEFYKSEAWAKLTNAINTSFNKLQQYPY